MSGKAWKFCNLHSFKIENHLCFIGMNTKKLNVGESVKGFDQISLGNEGLSMNFISKIQWPPRWGYF